MFVKALLATLVLASSTFGLAPPQLHKRDVHNRHAHVVARTPVPILSSTDATKPLRRRHARTKRCQNRPQTPDASAPVNVEAVSSVPPQSQQPSTSAPAQTEPTYTQPDQPTYTQPDQPTYTQPSSGGGGGGRQMTGDGTYYAAGLGACGIVNTDADYIAAVSKEVFDGYGGYWGTNPNNNPICGKQITATFEGKSVTVVITDRCGGCIGPTDVDFTPTAFNHLGAEERGRLKGIQWTLPDA